MDTMPLAVATLGESEPTAMNSDVVPNMRMTVRRTKIPHLAASAWKPAIQ